MTERFIDETRTFRSNPLSIGQMTREFMRANFCELTDLGSRISAIRKTKKGDYSDVVVGLGMVIDSKSSDIKRRYGDDIPSFAPPREVRIIRELDYLKALKAFLTKYKDRLGQNLDLSAEDFRVPEDELSEEQNINPVLYLNFLREQMLVVSKYLRVFPWS